MELKRGPIAALLKLPLPQYDLKVHIWNHRYSPIKRPYGSAFKHRKQIHRPLYQYELSLRDSQERQNSHMLKLFQCLLSLFPVVCKRWNSLIFWSSNIFTENGYEYIIKTYFSYFSRIKSLLIILWGNHAFSLRSIKQYWLKIQNELTRTQKCQL